MAETFLYLAAEWRAMNKLDHYRVSADFGVECVPMVPTELTLLHQEAQIRHFNQYWNTILDFHVKLISKKPTP